MGASSVLAASSPQVFGRGGEDRLGPEGIHKGISNKVTKWREGGGDAEP